MVQVVDLRRIDYEIMSIAQCYACYLMRALCDFGAHAWRMRGSVAEWSKALVLGTSQKWRGFESRRCQIPFFLLIFRKYLKMVNSSLFSLKVASFCYIFDNFHVDST